MTKHEFVTEVSSERKLGRRANSRTEGESRQRKRKLTRKAKAKIEKKARVSGRARLELLKGEGYSQKLVPLAHWSRLVRQTQN